MKQIFNEFYQEFSEQIPPTFEFEAATTAIATFIRELPFWVLCAWYSLLTLDRRGDRIK